ncbi:MAG: glycosyltransferase family 87 protein [Gemmataceae bacterium]
MPTLAFSRFTRIAASRFTQQSWLRVAFLGLLAVVLLITSVKYAAKVAKPADNGEQSRSAFLRWRTMVRDVFTGTNIYVGKNEYPNPPVMAIILRPFVELPPVVGAMTWFYTKVLMAVLAALWCFRLVRPNPPTPFPAREGGARQPAERLSSSPPALGEGLREGFSSSLADIAKAAAILLALPSLMGDLTHNNVNIFILFLVAGCLELYRRGRDTASGLVLGLAIACKVTPLLFLAFFVWKRAGRVVYGCAMGLVLWLALVPGAVFGWDRNAELLTDWYKLMVERPVLKGEITTEHPNQSIVGFVYRLGTHSPSFIDYEQTPEGDIPVPAAYHNLCDIGRPAAWVVVKLFTLAFAVAIMVLCRSPRSEREGWRFTAECGLIVLAMLLLSERTWKHHAVVLLLPAAVLTLAAAFELKDRSRRFVVGSLVAAAALMTLPGLFGPRASDLAMVYGTHTFAFGLFTLALCVVLAQPRDRLERKETGSLVPG